MKELDNFISFLIENRSDTRISVSRKMKFGFKHFYIDFYNDHYDKQNLSPYLRHSLTIIIDNRNNCIEINQENFNKSFVIQNDELIQKWSKKIDQILDEEIEGQITKIIETTLMDCENKNLHREYLMKKIIKDEPL